MIYSITGSGNVLLPIGPQAITCIKFQLNSFQTQTFSFNDMHLKLSFANCWPCLFGLNRLNCILVAYMVYLISHIYTEICDSLPRKAPFIGLSGCLQGRCNVQLFCRYPKAWWRYDMELHSVLLAIGEENRSVTGGLPSQTGSDDEHLYLMLTEKNEQIEKLSVIRDATTLMWRYISIMNSMRMAWVMHGLLDCWVMRWIHMCYGTHAV